MLAAAAYRGTVLLLWAQVALGAWVCRGLFWDGASFLANMLETGTYHDFYPARAHVAWLNETPVLLLARAGVRWIQPGIESLDDNLLALIAKGNSTLMNVQLLKWSLEFGIDAAWNMLCGQARSAPSRK